tara:strand:- start:383 stop:1090 length:708 start_codon:yes stop_codon:yes gene_type:complete
MATFTDLSQSTQAGDPVVSTLISGLDRNQIAAFEGDPTATLFLQAENDAFTPSSITTNKLGPHADGSSLGPVDSIELSGDWGDYSDLGGNFRGIVKTFTRAGTYRIIGELGFSAAGGGITLGSAKMRLFDANGTIAESDTADTLNTFVYINQLVTVTAGQTLTLIGFDGDDTGSVQPKFKMRYKIFAKDSHVEAPKTVGFSLNRQRVFVISASFPAVINVKHIDWDSTPYPGNIS